LARPFCDGETRTRPGTPRFSVGDDEAFDWADLQGLS
jgi:hypothetical protein